MSALIRSNDWHAKTFKDAEWWREMSERWDSLGTAAALDGDDHHAKIARGEAAGCRQNARLIDLGARP